MVLNKKLTVIVLFLIALHGISQQQVLSVALTTRLDSLRMCTGKERHFGELYLHTTRSVDKFIETLPENGRYLMKRMEESFATYFFRAIEANNNATEIPDEWENYFSDDHSSLQLKLMGANAHINGDIWQALTDNFSFDEIKQIKPFYKKYNKPINKAFDSFFKSAIRSDKRLHDLHLITLGLDKVYGRMVLHKWRNRQLRLAIFHFSSHQRFLKLKRRTDHKRQKLDRMIIKKLHVNGFSL